MPPETYDDRPPPVIIGVAALADLCDMLHGLGYTIVGPTVRDGAIVLAELSGAAELPYGWGVDTEAGRYRLRPRGDTAAFGHSAGPQSWKDVLHPPRVKLWEAQRTPDGGVAVTETVERRRYALLGVRPCDLAAIRILDRVLTGGRHVDPQYAARRDGNFVIAVECTEPGATCFCTSMGTGPQADAGFDLAMTELLDGGDHRFLVRAGTPSGAEVLSGLPGRPADDAIRSRAADAVAHAATAMGRSMPAEGLPELLAASRTSPHWEDVASRCLTCGNCTMVCPTCFCSTTEDVTDLTGDHAQRWRRSDSCFDLDFSYLHGGSVRTSGQARYRQWISHKLGTWHEQFGSSGCVGCGRCIAWCPTGIDITQEIAALSGLRAAASPAGGDQP
ncbi:4Fe-4S dicluster domain-containing protein [Actinoplanes teichomyceticus]|uniref:4Fe-4S dicluster protein n=1 Tax=Actinoplanes teichomyceticus TaxID=1867 RepID=A0A561VLR5_ACTTI|nr:4Fe-4S dicluster domain-containing protein [Actinoplanes teichomyceticus]TWG12556.1 4Fe-4S dicluster protein [Actinoplanes teichomyceticus]GIF13922.1 4Fe-4S ferredoxin [Actinoplanes teichomyceticus]